VQIPQGVAVLATDTWSAKKGPRCPVGHWDDSKAFKLGSDEILAKYKEMAKKPGLIAANKGDTAKAFAGAAKVVSASFDFPYLAHAAMEPMNCVVQLKADGCEVWNGEQFQTVDQGRVAALFGLKPEQVKLNMLYAGGSFGRRACTHSDYVMEAAHIVKAINGRPRSSWSGCARTTCAAATTGRSSTMRWKRRSMAAASWSAGITGWSGSRS
jgi:isoquinoline 1-oxidoreductase beta subunit